MQRHWFTRLAGLGCISMLVLAGCQTSGSSEQQSPSTPSTSQSAPPSPGSTPQEPASAGTPAPSAPGAPPAGTQEGEQPDAGKPQSEQDQSQDSTAGGAPQGDTDTADADSDVVLEQAMEAFRRSAARERASELPQTLPEGESQTEQAGTDGAGDVDDLTGRDLEDLLAGESRQDGADSEASGAVSDSARDDSLRAGDSGSWHQPGTGGRTADPDSGQVYQRTDQADGEPGGSAGSAATRPRTQAERQAELERILSESMGDFDGRILDEREAIMARRDRDAQEDRTGETDQREAGGGTGTDGTGRRPAPAAPGVGSGSDHVGGGPVGGPATDSQRDGEFPVPDDIGDGANDDVVARQLREAAMNEPDPELREKLWDEYRRYVEGRR